MIIQGYRALVRTKRTDVANRLISEAARRSGVVWVTFGSHPPRVVWHRWHDDALWLVTGGSEQQLPGADTATSARVTVRSKATQNDQVVTWTAEVARIEPRTPAWDAVVALLHAQRLNAPDGEAQPDRWARESVLLRLSPAS
jgi:hypothetical protein